MSTIIHNNFEMTELERQVAALSTITNMLVARKWIDKNNKTLLNTTDIINTISIDCLNNKVAIKFYNSKLNTLNDREIETFFASYPGYHRIIIVNDIATKAEKQVMSSQNIEVFRIMEVIKDISKHHLVPKHILLSKDEANTVMSEYKLNKKDMGRIYIDDPMARYLYAQKDDVIQVIRENINSGYSTYYRLVVLGSIYN